MEKKGGFFFFAKEWLHILDDMYMRIMGRKEEGKKKEEKNMMMERLRLIIRDSSRPLSFFLQDEERLAWGLNLPSSSWTESLQKQESPN